MRGLKTVLAGHDDWINIVIPIATSPGGGAGGQEEPGGYSCRAAPIN
jgi:hypothetical protein